MTREHKTVREPQHKSNVYQVCSSALPKYNKLQATASTQPHTVRLLPYPFILQYDKTTFREKLGLLHSTCEVITSLTQATWAASTTTDSLK